jgi:hypothetical protein
MVFKNLDNERDNLLNFINNSGATIDALGVDVGALESAVFNPQPPIVDALESEELVTPTIAEFDALVGTVNAILGALRDYGIIEETP